MTYVGGVVMAIREIKPWSDDDGDGLDFGEYWDDAEMVVRALWKLAVGLQPAVCYCLSLDAVHGGISSFRPYRTTGLITHAGITLPDGIQYDRLLDKDDRWPSLAEWTSCGGAPASHPPELNSAVWYGQVKLKSGAAFVGYFKAAVCTGKPPSDDVVKDAYRQTKLWLDAELSRRREEDPKFKASLSSTRAEIEQDIKAGKTAVAIRRLATLVTSHLSSGFNRILCLVPVGSDLECIYAHGGDCSDDWARRIQRPLSEETNTFPELQAKVDPNIPPIDDPFYRDLAGDDRLRLIDVNTSGSLVARLWRNDGNLEALRVEDAIEGDPLPPDIAKNMVLVCAMPNIAAKIGFSDSLFEEWRKKKPESPLFWSRNGVVYALPWSVDGRLAAIWVVDLGCWSSVCRRELVARLKAAKAILKEFAESFSAPITASIP